MDGGNDSPGSSTLALCTKGALRVNGIQTHIETASALRTMTPCLIFTDVTLLGGHFLLKFPLVYIPSPSSISLSVNCFGLACQT